MALIRALSGSGGGSAGQVLLDEVYNVTTGTQSFNTRIDINDAKNVIAFTTDHTFVTTYARGGFWTINNGTPTLVCNSNNGTITTSGDEIVVGVKDLAASYLPCKLKVVITS